MPSRADPDRPHGPAVEVFLLSRMREAHDRGATDQAIVEGLGRTGRLITSAALIF